jgi:YD repeat-containing protein
VSVRVAGIEFDKVAYYRGEDVLYLHVGDPAGAVDFDESPEGHHLRYDPEGRLVGITIVNARWLLEQDGRIVVTLPERRIELTDLGDVLAPA